MKMAPAVLEMMYDMLGTRRYFNTLKFDYNPVRIAREMTLMTSSGIRPGPSKIAVSPTVSGTVNGVKVIQMTHALKTHREWVRKAMTMDVDLPNQNVIKHKMERRTAYMGSMSAVIAIHRKKREFFIPSLLTLIHNLWVGKSRMLIERGYVINVGLVLWYGGAQRFAESLHAENPRQGWSEGDYKWHDKHIRDYLLAMYMLSNSVYYDVDAMTPAIRDLFYRANLYALYNMVIKPTLHLNGLWTLIAGVLWSGGPETSPGGSWCTLFMFCTFLVHQMSRHPKLAGAIKAAIMVKLILIAIYGDDHLYTYPLRLEAVLNGHEFAKFSKEYFGSIIRDVLVHRTFFSVPDPRTGELLKTGPKFLKRYFIRGEKGEILPYKNTFETLAKLVTPKTEEPLDFVLSSIGQAWDTMFTNRIAYNMARVVFEVMIKLCDKSVSQIILEAIKQGQESKAYTMFRKLGLKIDVLARGFPDYDIERELMHAYDHDKFDHTAIPSRVHVVEGVIYTI